MPAAAGITDLVGADLAGLFGAGTAAAAEAAPEAGALGVLDAGLVGGAVPGAIAGDALGTGALAAGGLADTGLGVADVSALEAAGLGGGADLTATGALGADTLAAIGGGGAGGAGGSSLIGPALNADIAAATPNAIATGAGTTAAGLPGGGGAVTAGDVLGMGAKDILQTTGPDLLGPGATAELGASDAATAVSPASGTFVGSGDIGFGSQVSTALNPALGTGPLDTSGAVQPTLNWGYDVPSAGMTAMTSPAAQAATSAAPNWANAGAVTATAQGPVSLGLGPGSTDWNAGLGLTSKGAVPAAADTGLFGTGISGKDAALYGLAGAPLALALMRGEGGLPSQAGQATALDPALQQYAQGIIASGGAPTQYQAAQIAQNSRNRLNQYRQILANQGVQDPQSDTRWAQFVALDQQQQMQEAAQFQQQNMSDALQAAGGAQSGLLAVAQMQAQQDAAYTQALTNAMGSAGRVLALGGAFGNRVQPTVAV
jgi:hypothetical protein